MLSKTRVVILMILKLINISSSSLKISNLYMYQDQLVFKNLKLVKVMISKIVMLLMMNLYIVLLRKNVLLTVYHMEKLLVVKSRKIFSNSLHLKKSSVSIFLSVMYLILLKLLVLNLIYIDKINKNLDILTKMIKLSSACQTLIGLY